MLLECIPAITPRNLPHGRVDSRVRLPAAPLWDSLCDGCFEPRHVAKPVFPEVGPALGGRSSRGRAPGPRSQIARLSLLICGKTPPLRSQGNRSRLIYSPLQVARADFPRFVASVLRSRLASILIDTYLGGARAKLCGFNPYIILERPARV